MDAIKITVKKGNISFKWNKLKTLNGAKVIGYILEYNDQEIYVNSNSYKIKNAAIGDDYSVRMQAVTTAGEGEWSNVQLFDVDDEIAPVAGKVIAEQTSQESVKLKLSGFSDNSGSIDHYNIYLNNELIASTTERIFLYEDKNLGGKLNFTVRAVDKYDNESKAAKASIKVADKTAPDQVSGLRVVGEVREAATVIAWDVPKDNVGVTSYLINVDGKKYTSKKTTLTLKKLSVSPHTISVIAMDKAKNYSEASVINIHVKDTTAPKKGKIKLTQPVANQIQIAISGFSDNSGSIDHYNIYLNGARVGTTSQTVYTYKGKDLNGDLNFAVEAVDATDNVSASVRASITIANKPSTLPPKTDDQGLVKTLAGIDAAVFLKEYNDYESASDLPSAAKFKTITGTAEKDTIIFEANKYSFVNGKITLAGGNDEIIVRNGAIMDCSGVVDFGDGNNSLTAGKNSRVLAGWNDSNFKFGSGNDTIKFDGCAEVDFESENRGGFYTGSGNDVLTANNVSEADGFIDMGAGNDTVNITGNTFWSSGYLNMGDGDDTVCIGKGSVLELDGMHEDNDGMSGINFGAGNDTLVLDGVLKLSYMKDYSNSQFSMLSGLEKVSGSGQLAVNINDINLLDSVLVDDLIEAGITVAQIPNIWAYYAGGRPENSDDTLASASEVAYDEDHDVWLNGIDWGDWANCPIDTVDWFRLDIGGSSDITTKHTLFVDNAYGWQAGFIKLDVYNQDGTFLKNISPDEYSYMSDYGMSAAVDLKEFGNGTYYLKFSMQSTNCGGVCFGVGTESEWYD